MSLKKYYIKYLRTLFSCCTAGCRTKVNSCLISIFDMHLKEQIDINQFFFLNIPFRNIINKTFKNIHFSNLIVNT